jgi:hypothetical protein
VLGDCERTKTCTGYDDLLEKKYKDYYLMNYALTDNRILISVKEKFVIVYRSSKHFKESN